MNSNNTRNAHGRPRGMSSIVFIFFLLFIFSFALDYKAAEDGGTFFQYAMLAAAICSGATLAVFTRWKEVPRALVTVIVCWFTVVFVGCLALMVDDLSLDRMGRVGVPYCLCGLAMVAVAACQSNGVRFDVTRKYLLASCIVSSAWVAAYAFTFGGLHLDEARHQFVSPGVQLIFGISLAQLLFTRKLSLWAVGLLGLTVLASIISVTRQLLVAGVVASMFGCGVLVYTRWIRRAGGVASSGFLTKALVVAGCGFVTSTVAVALRPEVFESWLYRLLWYKHASTEADPTFLTRLAEWKGQIDGLNESSKYWIWGKGLGANYLWSVDYRDELRPFVGLVASEQYYWTPGHNTWIYQLFATGLIGCGLTLFIFLFCCKSVARTLAMSRHAVGVNLDGHASWPMIALVTSLSASLTSNLFTYRLGAIYFGLTLACVFWAEQHFASITKGQRPRLAVGEKQ